MIADFKKLFESNLELLARETHATKEQILKSRTDENCDCRFMLIHIAREYKVPDCQIMAFSGFTRQQLQRAAAQAEQRLKKLDIKILMPKIRKNTEMLINEVLN